MRTSLIIPAGLILAGTLLAALQSQAQPADKTITFFVKKSVVIDTTSEKIVTIAKGASKTKLKTCANGNHPRWTAMTSDATGARVPVLFDLVGNGIPSNGARITSIRVDGTCKEGTVEWTKYSGVVEKEKPKPAAAAATPATPKPSPTPTH